MRKPILLLLLPAILFFLCTGGTAAGAGRADMQLEYKVKAGFLVNFAKFIKWPEGSFAGANAPLVIGVIGDNPFDGALKAAELKNINDRPVKFIEAATAHEVKSCHLVFISRSLRNRYADLLRQLSGSPVVHVSDIPGFAAQGGIIEFVFNKGRLSFIINNGEARKSRIDISANLLQLAKEVM